MVQSAARDLRACDQESRIYVERDTIRHELIDVVHLGIAQGDAAVGPIQHVLEGAGRAVPEGRPWIMMSPPVVW